MRSPRRALIESLREDLDEERRFVDCAAQIRVYRRGPDGAEPGELLPRIYGGRYDTWTAAWSEDPPEVIREISCHPGQLEMLVYEGDELRTLLLGAPGGGKTFAAVAKIALLAIDRPNSVGGAVAPVADRKQVLWDDLLNLLEPFGWVSSKTQSSQKPWSIKLVNGTVVQIIAAKKQSRKTGTPLKGYSWDWAIEDEQQNIEDDSLLEVQFRGRRAGKAFRIYSTATNEPNPMFELRLERWREIPEKVRILRFRGRDNVFVDPEHWENQRPFLSDDDYNRIVEADDVHDTTGLVYPKWDRDVHLRALPEVAEDITGELVQEIFGEKVQAKFIVGHDFGKAHNFSVVLKAFREPHTGERLWWAFDEIMTAGSSSEPEAAHALRAKYPARDVVILGDPHTDEDTTTRSDYRQFANAGFRIYPASGARIVRKHRFSMVNALLADAARPPKARLFIACDRQRFPKCPKLAESLKLYRLEDVGKKGPHDVSHASDALGYGLFRWEKIRGAMVIGDDERRAAENDKLIRKLSRRLKSR